MGGKVSGPVGAAIIAIVLIIVAVIAYKFIFTSSASMSPQAKAFQDQMRAAHPTTPAGAAPRAPGAGGYPAGPRR